MPSINSSSTANHPYYPLEVEIASYLANEWSVPVLLGTFAGVCATVLLATLLTVNKVHPNLRGSEKAAIWWFVLCESSKATSELLTLTINLAGSIHLFFEGTHSR
jgi:cholestenol Delta-isomerase